MIIVIVRKLINSKISVVYYLNHFVYSNCQVDDVIKAVQNLIVSYNVKNGEVLSREVNHSCTMVLNSKVLLNS